MSGSTRGTLSVKSAAGDVRERVNGALLDERHAAACRYEMCGASSASPILPISGRIV